MKPSYPVKEENWLIEHLWCSCHITGPDGTRKGWDWKHRLGFTAILLAAGSVILGASFALLGIAKLAVLLFS